MGRRCSICDRPDREAIDQALGAGQALRDIAGHSRLSTALAEALEGVSPAGYAAIWRCVVDVAAVAEALAGQEDQGG